MQPGRQPPAPNPIGNEKPLNVAVLTDLPESFSQLAEAPAPNASTTACRFEAFTLEHDVSSLITKDFCVRFDCMLVDIRSRQQRQLESLAACTLALPVLVVTDDDTGFEPDYPFGCPIIDIIHIEELKHPRPTVFTRRIRQAIKLFVSPLHLDHLNHPVSKAFQQIVDNSSDWIIVKDLDHRFIVVPEEFCETTGHTMQQTIGKNDLEINTSEQDVLGMLDDGSPGFWARDDEVTRSGITSVEDSPKWQVFNSEVRHKHTHRVPLFNSFGQVHALLVCVKDITEQKDNERLLIERTDMLGQVTAEKQKTEQHKDIAESAVEAKNRFLAAASHDLRQPLHAMGLFLDVLNSRLTREEDLKLMAKLRESTTALYAMFSSLLDISRLDAGVVVPDITHVPAQSCCDVLENEYRQIATEKGLDFHCDIEPCWLFTDSLLFTRIVRNLVDNAIENTQHGGIRLSVRQQQDNVEVSVTDTGCGIDENELENIFFEYHSPGSKRHGSGIGLGLAIVHRLCRLLDIEISVESIVGTQSVFSLRVPAGKEFARRAEPRSQMTENQHNLLVLVIDDEEAILQGTESMLELHGCKTLVASSIDCAFELLATASNLPDIIVADYELGEKSNGVTAIKRIRLETDSHIPAILVTGDTSEQRKVEASSVDIELLHKPVNAPELVNAIRRTRNRAGPVSL